MVFIQTACLYIRTGITDIRSLGRFVTEPGYVVFTFLDNLSLVTISTLIITRQFSANVFVIAGCIVYTCFAIISVILIRDKFTMTLYFLRNRRWILPKYSCDTGKRTAL